MPLTSTPTNLGSGGASVATDQQSSGVQFPVSEIGYSPDGVQDAKLVTPTYPFPTGGINPATGLPLTASVVPANGVNEQAVYDARANAARDELRVTLGAILDALTNSVLQVAAKIAGSPAGNPDTVNVTSVQGVLGGMPQAATLQSPANAGGAQVTVFAPGELRVLHEPVQIFVDSFDAGVDIVNKWQVPTAGGGGVLANLVTPAATFLGTGTTPGGYSILQTQPAFPPQSPGFLVIYNAVNLEYPRQTGGKRFWGIGTVSGPTASTPMVDGVGWEVDVDGKLYAVLYQGGAGRTLAVDVSRYITDSGVHKYYIYFRGDVQYWAIDGQDNIVAYQPTGAPGPNVNTMPYAMVCVAANPAPGSSLILTSNSVWVGDTSSSQISIADGTYCWRTATVKPPATPPVAADSALVVTISPNTPIGGVGLYTGLPLSPSVVPSNGINELAVFDARGASGADEMRLSLAAILDALTNTVLQVAAKIAGAPAGSPDVANVVGVQGVPGGMPQPAILQSPPAAGGAQATVFAPGELRVLPEPAQMFVDSFDAGVDIVNKWIAPIAAGGGVIANIVTSAGTFLGTGTTPGGYSILQTQPTFPPQSPGFLVVYNAVNLEYPRLPGGKRFWGIGSVGIPTAAAPVIDGVGFEVDIDGKLYAVLYQGGAGRTLAIDVSRYVADSNVHKFYIYFRGDVQYWAIDGQDTIVAYQPTGAPGPNVNTLNYTMVCVAANPAPGGNLILSSNSVWVGDTSAGHTSISDGTYGWRTATIKSPGVPPVANDTTLVVSMSPTTPIGGVSPYTGLPLSPSVIPSNGINEEQVFNPRAQAALDEMRLSLQAILDCLQATAKVEK